MVLEYRVRYIQATQLKQVLFQCRDCKDLIAHHWRSFAIPSCNNFEKSCSNSSQVHSITIIWLHQIHFKSTRHHQASGASSAALGASPTSLLHFDAELSIMTCIAGQRVSWYSLVCILVHSHAISFGGVAHSGAWWCILVHNSALAQWTGGPVMSG